MFEHYSFDVSTLIKSLLHMLDEVQSESKEIEARGHDLHKHVIIVTGHGQQTG